MQGVGVNELALFAGAGGGILASHLMGLRTICAVERDAYAAQVLAQRQNDGILPAFPIWSDITTFDGKPWCGIVDVISGGFPCQDISSAGKGAGIDGERSGLWSEMARIIGEVRPGEVWVENSPMLISRGLTRIISDLTKMGYDSHWARFSASNFGAPHIRDRVWIVGYSRSERFCSIGNNNYQYDREITCTAGQHTKLLAYTSSDRLEKEWLSWGLDAKKPDFGCDGPYVSNSKSDRWKQAREGKFTSSERISGSGKERSRWWGIEPELGRVANGVAYRVDRLKAIGNGQVPIVAKSAFEFLRGN